MRGGKTIGVILGTLLLGATALGLNGYLLRSRVLSAVAATTRVQADLQRRDLRAGCADLQSAAVAWDSAAALSQTLAPILRRLGWLPALGADLRVAPDAILRDAEIR